MKVLPYGENGQDGWELQRAIAPLDDLIVLDRHATGGVSGDLSGLEGLAVTIRMFAPGGMVNAAAYTAVDKAESEPDLARWVNAESPKLLAREAIAFGAWLEYYSTTKFSTVTARHVLERSATWPQLTNGRSKLQVEAAITTCGARAVILRTSWVYTSHGKNVTKTILRLARERETLNAGGGADEFGASNGTASNADVKAHIVRRALQEPDTSQLTSIDHLVTVGETTWHGYEEFVVTHASSQGQPLKVSTEQVSAISSKDYPARAKRPHNSRLDLAKLKTTFNHKMPPWQQGVQRMLDEIQL